MKTVELIAKEKDVAEAFFDQITTAAWNVLERIGLSKKRPCHDASRLVVTNPAQSNLWGGRNGDS